MKGEAMSKIVVWMQMSLDGKTQGPGGEFDWPIVKDEKPMPKLVFSSTLRDAQWNTTVLDGVDQRVRDRRDAARGDLYLFGGSHIVGEFARQDLVDEYQVFVHPVALGGGAPLFPCPAERQGFSLRQSRLFDDTVIGLRYARARA